MGMIDREKVINNLEYQNRLLYDIIPHVSRDDGEYLEAAAKTMSDALALLEAQEPRVMTLEEVKAKPDYAWIEKLDSKKTYIVLFDFTAVLSYLSSYAHTWNHYGKDELLLLLLYNKTWRCWTSRPTDAQREATSWNE